MKHSVIFTVIFAILILLSPEIKSQVKINVKRKVNNEADRRANKAADKTIDAGFDKLEEGIKGVFRKKDDKATGQDEDARATGKEEETAGTSGKQSQSGAGKEIKAAGPVLSWSKFDFVPGDAVIFEDNQQNEENGEFPSRWDLVRGNIEIAKVDGENVIMMRDGAPSIVPYFKDPQKDYLPDVFTIEMDLYYPGSGSFEIHLFDRKNQQSGSPTGYTYLQVQHDQMLLGTARSRYPDENLADKRWMHISIAYTDGKLKAYMDDTRLINIPRIDFDPKGLTLYTYHARNDNQYYIKNVRIAKGGVKYYDRVMQDGKIIVNGIRFDVNKSTLKPESMGAINEIYNLMNDNPDLKFSVEGHTDSQGDDAFNMKLSEERANTVMNTLIKMGISADRLAAKGWGESKPISNNASPEDMANNRRVEFVKI